MNPIRKTFLLDILRGLAAFYVLVGHIKWLLWEGYTEGYKMHPEAYSGFEKAIMYGFTGFSFGHQAVMLFFVLSGFVIHYSTYNQSLKEDGFAIGTYLYKRIKRIYPPFLLALLITWVLDSIGRRYGYDIYFSTTTVATFNQNIHSDLTWTTLIGNLTMLQTLYTPVLGTNGPLWSLMYEWWFYVLYIPVFYINKKHPIYTAVLIGLVFLAVLFIPTYDQRWAFKTISIFTYFFAWYFGVICADVYMDRIKGVKTITGLGMYVLAVLAAGLYIKSFNFIDDYVTAVVFVGVIYLSLRYYQKLTFLSTLQPLSDISYTLYVIHVPIAVFMSGWLQRKYNGALPMHFGYVFLGIGICLMVAWAAHFVVEKPFVRKKKVVSSQ